MNHDRELYVVHSFIASFSLMLNDTAIISMHSLIIFLSCILYSWGLSFLPSEVLPCVYKRCITYLSLLLMLFIARTR